MMVVKLGGASGIDFKQLTPDIAAFVKNGKKVVIVHGGSDIANELTVRLGMNVRNIVSPSGVQSRYTDRATLEVMLMACAGYLNKLIVEGLQQMGINAVGLTGLDGKLLIGTRKKAVKAVEGGRTILIRDDQSGRVEEVNTELLEMLLNAGYVPVLSAFALSDESTALNVDADRVAAKVASAMQAEEMILLTNVPGLLHDINDPSSLVKQIKLAHLEEYQKLAYGRMKKKLIAAKEAVLEGVKRVVIADGRRTTPLMSALQGEGTVITA